MSARGEDVKLWLGARLWVSGLWVRPPTGARKAFSEVRRGISTMRSSAFSEESAEGQPDLWRRGLECFLALVSMRGLR